MNIRNLQKVAKKLKKGEKEEEGKGEKEREREERKKELGGERKAPKISLIIRRAARAIKGKGKKKKKKKKRRGIPIPEMETLGKIEKKERKAPDITEVDSYYPLIPKKPKKDEPIYAYAHIHWDDVQEILVYDVIQPKLSRDEKILLERVKETIQERLDVNFAKLKSERARDYLDEKLSEVLDFLGVSLGKKRRKKIQYYLYRDYIGLGKIEPLMHDPYIEDISCDGIGIPIYVYHRNPFFGSIQTDVVFETKEELDPFVMKLAQKGEKPISMADPLVDASLPDGSRIQLTLGTDIAKRGSNFTIRKFVEEPLTPVDLMNFGTGDSRMFAYLWYCIEHGESVLVAGSTATGKTTFLNVLSMFIKPNMKIVSIEDTPELKFSHPHWISEVAREPISETKGKEFGKVDLYDLLKSSLRQRPDYLIVGEVRGREAYVLFQQMVTGHPGLSTVHADSVDRLVDRLTTEPISLPANLIQNLDIIIFLKKMKVGKTYLRRAANVLEVEKYDEKENKIVANEVFKWKAGRDNYISGSGSIILENLAESTGEKKEKIRKEIENRIKILKWARERGISDYREFGKIVRLYYANSEELLKTVE